jgi:hypothetical protein
MSIDREVVAYHEAGHAVAAHALELTVERISIESDGDAAGHVIHDYGCNMNEIIYEDDNATREWALARAAIIALSGEEAQRHFRPDSVEEYHGEGDRLFVHQVLDALAEEQDQELRDAWATLLRLRAQRLVLEKWFRVEWIAALLLRQTVIEGQKEIRHAMADAALPLEYRGKHLSTSDRLALLAGKSIRKPQ